MFNLYYNNTQVQSCTARAETEWHAQAECVRCSSQVRNQSNAVWEATDLHSARRDRMARAGRVRAMQQSSPQSVKRGKRLHASNLVPRTTRKKKEMKTVQAGEKSAKVCENAKTVFRRAQTSGRDRRQSKGHGGGGVCDPHKQVCDPHKHVKVRKHSERRLEIPPHGRTPTANRLQQLRRQGARGCA